MERLGGGVAGGADDTYGVSSSEFFLSADNGS